MARTYEEQVEAAARARAARSAQAKERRRLAKQGKARTTEGATRQPEREVRRPPSGQARGVRKSKGEPQTTGDAVKSAARNGDSLLRTPIFPDCDYPLDVFLRVTGLTLPTVRRCQREGLRVCRFGNRRFILGNDWIAFRVKHAGDEIES